MLAQDNPLPFLKLIAHDLRWHLLQLLAESDRRVQELVERCGRPQNLVSYHLRQLRQQGLVHERHSSADGRDIYYSADLVKLQQGFQQSALGLHPAFLHSEQGGEQGVSSRPIPVLFLCTHNSARSQMAEGLLRQMGGERFEVLSAGTEQTRVHPLAIKAAAGLGVDISRHHSKTVEQFHDQTFDYVITVCDSAREICPVFPGHPNQIHWSFADPSAVTGTETERLTAFEETAAQLERRIRYFMKRSRSVSVDR